LTAQTTLFRWNIIHPAEDDKCAALRLVCIARRIQQWVEPIIYRVIAVQPHPKTHAFLVALDTAPKSPEFYAHHVKGFWSFDLQSDDVLRILSLCSGVTIIDSWFDWAADDVDVLDTAIGRLRPQRLTIDEKTFGTAKADFSHPFFSSITHLCMAVHWKYWTSSAFDIMPYLTHIDLCFELHARSDMSVILAAVLHILSSCKALRVCLFRETYPHWENYEDYEGRHASLVDASETLDQIEDPRIVLCEYGSSIEDWRALWAGKLDVWSWAEAYVEKRKV